LPRRKYGRMVHNLPTPPPPHKCRACKMKMPCPIHPKGLAGERIQRHETDRHSKKSHKVRYTSDTN
jgi:hypothetical protein